MHVDETKPDLSHLTPAERRIIEDVINRQKQDEIQNNQVSQKPVNVDNRLTQQNVTNNRNVQNSFSQIQQHNPQIQKKDSNLNNNKNVNHLSSGQGTEKIGNPLETVASLVKTGITSLTESSCNLCKKTKFADTLGHQCYRCKQRICSKCGIQVQLPKNFFDTDNSKDCQIIFCWICLQCSNKDQRLWNIVQQHQQIQANQQVNYMMNPMNNDYSNQSGVSNYTMEQAQEYYYNQNYANTMQNPMQESGQTKEQLGSGKNPLYLAVDGVLNFGGLINNELSKTPTNANAQNTFQPPSFSQGSKNNSKPKGILEGITEIFGGSTSSKGHLPTNQTNPDPNKNLKNYGQTTIPSWKIDDTYANNEYQNFSNMPSNPKTMYQDHPYYDHRAYTGYSDIPIHDPVTGYQYSKVPSRYRDQLREHKLHYLSFSSSEGEDLDNEHYHQYHYFDPHHASKSFSLHNRPYVTVTDDEDPASQFYISTNQYRSHCGGRRYPRSVNESRRMMPNIETIMSMEKNSVPNNFRKLNLRGFSHDNSSILSEPDYFPEDQVSWSTSQNEKFLLGHMVLFRPPDSSTNRNLISAIGLRLSIGEQHPLVPSRFGTFVSKVKWGSPADMVGHIRPGDEIVEWNRINLINLHPDEVNQILFASRNDNRVEIVLQRPSDGDHPFEMHSSAFANSTYPREIMDMESTGYAEAITESDIPLNPDEKPSIQLKFWYNTETDELTVNVLSARLLSSRLADGQMACNSYCKLDLLPYEKGRSQRSRLIPNNPNPRWYQKFTFGPFREKALGEHDLEITIWDADRTLDKSAQIGQLIIDLNYADLNDVPYWFPLQMKSFDGADSVIPNAEISAHEFYTENAKKKSTSSLARLLRPGPIGMRHRSAQRLMDDETLSDSRFLSRRGYHERLEDDFCHDSDVSEISDVSDLSKISIGSDYQKGRMNIDSSKRSNLNVNNQTRNDESYYHHGNQKLTNLSMCSESSFSTVSGMGDYNEMNKKHQSVFKNTMYNTNANNKSEENVTNEKSEQNINEVRKRRPSIGQKFSNVLGLSRKSSSTSNLDKKSRASFQRSSEVIPAHVKPTEKSVTGYTAPAYTSEQGKMSVFQQPTTSQKLMICDVSQKNPEEPGIPSSNEGTNASGEAHVGEFVDGLGPGQLVGRQVLGMPCLGEIQLSFIDRKGKLEVDVIRARGLQQRCSGKVLPAPYVKLHLLEGKQSVEKLRTSNPIVRTLDPLYQQQLTFNTPYHGKILQVSVWGEFGRMEKKIFMGMCEIVLDDLEISSIVFGWYKLFGMIASNLQSFTTKT